MDLFIQKAKLFAQETAKKSQEIAMEAAKLSQELAQETAKRSRELSHDFVVEASKKADQIKLLANELSPGIVGGGVQSEPLMPSEEELYEYGVTPELREFVKGLTIRTFRDFPLEESSWKKAESTLGGGVQVRTDLSEWQERHAVLVLMTIPEISDFRYVLCPRRMRESKFWKVYFILVQGHVAPFEQRAAEKAKAEEESVSIATEGLSGTTVQDNPAGSFTQTSAGKKTMNSAEADKDLDAYLMGALGSDDEGAEGLDEDFDKDFDQLVNSTTLDSDGEDAAHEKAGAKGSVKGGSQSGAEKLSFADGSSDGELVEIPDQESETTQKKGEETAVVK